MNQTSIFRFLIVAAVTIAVIGACIDSLMPGLLPPILENAYDTYIATEEPVLWLTLAVGGFSLVLFIAGIVSTIGLLLFKRWSRPLSFWLSVLSVFSYPFFGAALYSGWSLMLTEISMMLWGAVLAMAYFSELRVRFEDPVANNVMQATREDARA